MTSHRSPDSGMRPGWEPHEVATDEDEANVPLFSSAGPSAEGTVLKRCSAEHRPRLPGALSTQISAANGGGVDSGRLWGLETVRMILRSSWIWAPGQKHVCSIPEASQRRHHPVNASGRSATSRRPRGGGEVRPGFSRGERGPQAALLQGAD